MEALFGITGLAMVVVSSIVLLIMAFRESLLWGLGSLLIPLVLLIFCLQRLEKTWKLLLIQVFGAGLLALGGV